MDPAFWGRSTWTYLHTLTFNYPENPTDNDKLKYYNYFKQLPDFLPCPSCASSFKIYFEYIPITDYLDDIHGITFWLYIIHFIVNSKLNKKNRPPKVQKLIDIHSGHRIAIVCHGGVINAYLTHTLGLTNFIQGFFYPNYTSIHRVAAARSGERSIVTINETSHLRGTGLPMGLVQKG